MGMTNQQRAEKIVQEFHGFDGYERKAMVELITTQLDAAVREAYYELAQKQANVMGESVMLCGKLVANEELYKQPTDYVKEAYAEGFAAKYREALEKISVSQTEFGNFTFEAKRAQEALREEA